MRLNCSFQQLSAWLASFIAGIIIKRGHDGELLHYQQAGYLAALTSVGCVFISRRLRPYREITFRRDANKRDDDSDLGNESPAQVA